MALGASAAEIRSRVLARAVGLAAAGVALGLGLAFFLAPRAGDVLYRVSPRDPTTFAVVALVLLVTAGVAGAIPARRATRVHPVETLRAE